MSRPAYLFGLRDALQYIEISPYGLPLKKAFQGDGFFSAPNPPFGAVFTYHLQEGFKTLKESRHEIEEKADKKGEIPSYPEITSLRTEDEETEPQIILSIRDSEGNLIRNITGDRSKGMHRIAWDLRYPASTPIDLDPPPPSPWSNPPAGAPVLPGKYTITLSLLSGGKLQQLDGPVGFSVKALDIATFPSTDRRTSLEFSRKAAELQRVVHGAGEKLGEIHDRLRHLGPALLDTPRADLKDMALIETLNSELNALDRELAGDSSLSSRNYPTPPSILGRVETVIQSQFYVSSAPTETHRRSLRWAEDAFSTWLPKLQKIEERVSALEEKLEKQGAPWTPGRLPVSSK